MTRYVRITRERHPARYLTEAEYLTTTELQADIAVTVDRAMGFRAGATKIITGASSVKGSRLQPP